MPLSEKDDRQLEDFFNLKNGGDAHENIKDFIKKNIGFRARLLLAPKVLSKKERYLIFAMLLVILGALIAVPISAYRHFTVSAPDRGGSFTEGVLGGPHFINPLLETTNTDRDLSTLLYSGLLTYNADGSLVPDLAESHEISGDGLTYTVFIKDNAQWHDGQPVTADDVIFTIQTAQNGDYGSPQQINWQGVSVEKVNDHAVQFKLKNPYAQFLNNLTLGILPKHVWENVQPINFSLSEFNTHSVGSGPYRFVRLRKNAAGEIVSYDLTAFDDFYDGKPFIKDITFNFYNTEDELIAAFNDNAIDNIGAISGASLSQVKFRQRITFHELDIPQYFAVFLNQNQNEFLADKNVRLALAHATDRQTILDTVLSGKGALVNSPMIETVLSYNADIRTYEFSTDRVAEILTGTGWTKQDDGVYAKGGKELRLTLTTSTWPELVSVANALKSQWESAGVGVTLNILQGADLQRAIKNREYDMLLFGAIMNPDPDPFSIWHSSKKRDGLNLTLYDNKTADGLLESARLTPNPLERMKKYEDFEKVVVEDIPAIFLYSPKYLYGQTNSIKGFNTTIIALPSDRFDTIMDWYMKTKRVGR